MVDTESRRVSMVNGQVLPNKVTDERLTDALLAVAREPFVPKNLRGVAYVDEDIPVGDGRYLLEPMIFARLLQEAEVTDHDVVLDIGCATGYSTAVLARLAGSVVALESDAALADKANEMLNQLDVDNAGVVTGTLVDGLPDQGPYDVIFMNGAVERLPDVLKQQLAEGGRLVVVQQADGTGQAWVYQRHGDVVDGRPRFDAHVKLLPGFEAEQVFSF